MLFLALWALSGTPRLGTPVAIRQPDGTWKCAAMCLTSGRTDGGECHTPTLATAPTEDACKAELAKKCEKTQPPPGGCYLDGNEAK